MDAEAGAPTTVIEWGVATRTLAGQPVSGDLHLVAARPDGVLVAVVDGLGHGAAAAHAAAIAVATLERHAHEPVTALVERCHERLRATRGVVMSLGALSAREHTLTWLGVGNVDGVLLRAEPAAQPALEWVPLRGGVVGDRLAPPHASTIPITRGDTLVFATDGFDDFVQSLTTDDAAQRVADRLLARHARGTDDALVLVARYLGPAR
jgi:serine/threonine protein phosphatase PrpC